VRELTPAERAAVAAQEAALRQAQARVGRTVDDRLRWIMQFAERDPRRLSPGDREVEREDVVGLVTSPILHLVPTGPRGKLRRLRFVWPSLAEVETIRRAVRHGLERVHAGTPWTLPRPPRAVLRTDVVRSANPVSVTAVSESDDLRAGVLHEVGTLLVACRRLWRCPECGRLFVRARRQLRHPKCSQRVRDRKRRGTTKEG